MPATTIAFDSRGPRALGDEDWSPEDITLKRRAPRVRSAAGGRNVRPHGVARIDGFEGLAPEVPTLGLTFDLDFARPVALHWVKMEDLENCAFLHLRDAHGNRLGDRITVWAPDDRPCTARIDREDVAGLTIEIAGAGALSSLSCTYPQRDAPFDRLRRVASVLPSSPVLFRSGRDAGAVLTARE
jgi:hypothetical protein